MNSKIDNLLGSSLMSVGGIYWSKHLGQSGQPMPDSVILTIDPAMITR